MLLSRITFFTVPDRSIAFLILCDRSSAMATMSPLPKTGGVMAMTASEPLKFSDDSSAMSPCVALKFGRDVNSAGALAVSR
jgi:hypothetical protein